MKSWVLSGLLLGLVPLTAGCQISYLLKSAKGQIGLLTSGVPLDEALKDPSLTPEERKKIEIAREARQFAENQLSLAHSNNYTKFVKLDRASVTYVVSASPKWELKNHQWSFPIVGKVPYKGFFNEADAIEEENNLKAEDLDTYRRGVSAYSTLGWFSDPLLSSMLRSKESDLVNTVIHETVHATIYIKSSSDFNERIATFIGNQGTEAFYFAKEGATSPSVERIREENVDEKLFSEFISAELKDLKVWYQDLKPEERQEELRQSRIKKIQENFAKHLKPKLRTDSYKRFAEIELNNARLSVYHTYMGDLSDFQNVFEKLGRNFGDFLRLSRRLEKDTKPEATMKSWATLSADELRKLLSE